MKKLNVLFLLLAGFIGISALTSCDPEPQTDVLPSMIFSTDGAAIANSTTVDTLAPLLFKISANENPNTKKNLQTLRVQSFKNNAPVKDTLVTINDDSFLGSFNFNADTSFSVAEKFIFTLIDREGEKAIKEIIITTKDAPVVVDPTGDPINSYSAKLLGGQSNPNEGSFFDAHTGTVLNTAGAITASATIDFIFAYGTMNQYYIGAPSDADIQTSHGTIAATWSTLNTTTFSPSSMTVADFDAMIDDRDFPTSTGVETKINMLGAGDVFSFLTVDGKFGMVKVNSVDGTVAGNRAIDIDVKVQQ